MRIASFTVDGRESYGIVSGGGIVDAKPHLGGEYRSVAALLEAVALDRLFEIEAVAPDYTLDDVQLLPPVTGRNPVLCVGRNYREVSEQAGYGPRPIRPSFSAETPPRSDMARRSSSRGSPISSTVRPNSRWSSDGAGGGFRRTGPSNSSPATRSSTRLR